MRHIRVVFIKMYNTSGKPICRPHKTPPQELLAHDTAKTSIISGHTKKILNILSEAKIKMVTQYYSVAYELITINKLCVSDYSNHSA